MENDQKEPEKAITAYQHDGSRILPTNRNEEVDVHHSIDFIGSSDTVKDLFALPFTSGQGVEIAIHNMKGTLLLDSSPTTISNESVEKEPLKLLPAVSNSLACSKDVPTRVADDMLAGKLYQEPSTECSVEEADHVLWKFNNTSLLVSPTSSLKVHDSDSGVPLTSIRVENLDNLRQTLMTFRNLKRGDKTYAEAVALDRAEHQAAVSIPELKVVRPSLGDVIGRENASHGAHTLTSQTASPVVTAIDMYLDNLIAHVPQLALCLEEKGFVSSVKLMKTEQIPAALLSEAIIDTSLPIQMMSNVCEDDLFSKATMETHAASLLQLLKTQCSTDNATYVLRRETGKTDVQLLDVSAISMQRHQRWNLWLVRMSRRFAQRMQSVERQLSDPALRRDYRSRQRSLLRNAISIVEELKDQADDESGHESLLASLHDELADTFIGPEGLVEASDPLLNKASLPYSIDTLEKAEDHLSLACRTLRSLLNSCHDERSSPITSHYVQAEFKLCQVRVFLINHHLVSSQYRSSNIMQLLKLTGSSLQQCSHFVSKQFDDSTKSIQLSKRWSSLWVGCATFASVFARDRRWREQGYMSLDDVLSVLKAVHEKWGSKHNHAVVGRSEVGFDPPTVTLAVSDEEKAICTTAESNLLGSSKLKYAEICASVAAVVAFWFALDIQKDNPSLQIPSRSLERCLGAECNEIGKRLIADAQYLLSNKSLTSTDDGIQSIGLILSSSRRWLEGGLGFFQQSEDLSNIALVFCNLCQYWKLKANSFFMGKESPSEHYETCLEQAAKELLRAHSALRSRDADPRTWDMVSVELAGTKLVLGVRRRQVLLGSSSTPLPAPGSRLWSGEEKSIVEPLQKALAIYTERNDVRGSAAASYQLGQYYTKVWTSQRDEKETRAKLSLAFKHFLHAHSLFRSMVEGNEPTFCLICIDLANLYSSVAGEKGLCQAFERCLDTKAVLSPEVMESARKSQSTEKFQDWLKQMAQLAENIETKVLKLLQQLAQLGNPELKNLYAVALKQKLAAVPSVDDNPYQSTHTMLDTLCKEYESWKESQAS